MAVLKRYAYVALALLVVLVFPGCVYSSKTGGKVSNSSGGESGVGYDDSSRILSESSFGKSASASSRAHGGGDSNGCPSASSRVAASSGAVVSYPDREPVDEYTYNELTINPVENPDMVLSNPDTGWVLYDNYVFSPGESPASPSCFVYGFDFPGVDNIILKFTWADIEKNEGSYDFSRANYIYDYWKSRGKVLHLGMSTESLLWYGTAATGIPQYVLNKIPESQKQVRNEYGHDFTVVDANNSYYQQRLKAYLDACAKNFSGNREVEIIDLRGFGMWGEWHTGYRYPSLAQKRTALSAVLNIWSKAFPKNWLALSYSYDPDDTTRSYANPSMYNQFLENSAYDIAANISNITWRRDGAGGAVQLNEYTFNENMFKTLTRGPMISEGAGGYSSREAAENIINDGLKLHPNYFTVIGWASKQAKDFMVNEPDLVNMVRNNLGYRLVPTRVTYPDAIAAGHNMTVSLNMVNRAVGRAVRDYLVRVALMSGGRNVFEFTLNSLDTSRYVKGNNYGRTVIGRVPLTAPQGEFDAFLRLYDTKTGRYVSMPVEGGKGTGGVGLGRIRVY